MQNKIFIEVSLPVPLHKNFLYYADTEIPVGSRVLVPFARQKLVGISLNNTQEKPQSNFEIKKIIETLDERPFFSSAQLRLALWLSHYYHTPQGEVFKAMLPGSNKKQNQKTWTLTNKGKQSIELSNLQKETKKEALKELFKNKKSLTQPTLQKKLKQFNAQHKSEVSLIELKNARWISLQEETKRQNRSSKLHVTDAKQELKDELIKKPDLNKTQKKALNEIASKNELSNLNKKNILKPRLLHGVTGSGKTEIYLNCIENIFLQNRLADPKHQVLIMVPEIALTPQMTAVFTARFPGQVAVVHSTLSDKERWQQLLSIFYNEKQILIGPRSSIFAPFEKLSLIVVDEEHDSSYKQNNSFSYNGRDVAIMRARLESALIILGSATPSVESYYNALQKKYKLIEMPERANKSPLPIVETIPIRGGLKGQILQAQTKVEEVLEQEKITQENLLCF